MHPPGHDIVSAFSMKTPNTSDEPSINVSKFSCNLAEQLTSFTDLLAQQGSTLFSRDFS